MKVCSVPAGGLKLNMKTAFREDYPYKKEQREIKTMFSQKQTAIRNAQYWRDFSILVAQSLNLANETMGWQSNKTITSKAANKILEDNFKFFFDFLLKKKADEKLLQKFDAYYSQKENPYDVKDREVTTPYGEKTLLKQIDLNKKVDVDKSIPF